MQGHIYKTKFPTETYKHTMHYRCKLPRSHKTSKYEGTVSFMNNCKKIVTNLGNKHIHSCNSLLVIIKPHVKCFYLFRVIIHNDRPFEYHLRQVSASNQAACLIFNHGRRMNVLSSFYNIYIKYMPTSHAQMLNPLPIQPYSQTSCQ